MGNNNKTGFSFYNADTDRFQDIRIKRLKKDLGCNGFAVYEYILNEIYRVKGCFLVWDECTAFDVADYWGLKENVVNEIITYCCAVGLFDKELLSCERIITSPSIQSRYIDMCIRAKRKDIKIPEEYLIVPEEYLKIMEEYLEIPVKSRRVEKSRVEKNIESKDSLDEFAFETVWAMYEKKGTSKVARSRWDKLPKTKKQLALKHIPLYVQATPDKKYRKNLETYINQEAWNDEIFTYAQDQNSDLGEGVWIENGKKYYGDKNNPREIPLSAPKRPGKQYAYDREKNSWTVL